MNNNETASALAFSRAAADYDEVSIGNPIVQRLRDRTQRRMRHYWRKGNSVLELNCGTGADALFLAKQGIGVLATDISSAMIARTQEKIAEKHLEALAGTRVLAFEQLSELRGTQFDGALSMFGGLNCTKNIENVFPDVALLLKPEGVFIASFLGKYSLWEILAYALRMNFRKAFRRWRRKPLLANVYDIKVPTYYWSVAELIQYASPYFTVERIESWSVVSPPPASLRFLRKHKALCEKLFSLEEKIADNYPFNRLGDHVILELKKK
jgi:ubiquinone/menaquinone biosynthesis C-methylase UbiE